MSMEIGMWNFRSVINGHCTDGKLSLDKQKYFLWVCDEFEFDLKTSQPQCTDTKGPFKYYVSKEVGGWGQQIAIFADLCWRKVGGPKNAKNMVA